MAGERGKGRTDDVLKRHVGEGGYLPLCWMAWRLGRKQSESTHDHGGWSASLEELNGCRCPFSATGDELQLIMAPVKTLT